jgi:hypothetical protein
VECSEIAEAALVLRELKASAAEPLVTEAFPSGRSEKGDKGEKEHEEEDHESVPIDLPSRRFGLVCLREYEQVLHLIKQKSGNARVRTRVAAWFVVRVPYADMVIAL